MVQGNLTTLSPTHFVAGNTITVQVSASDGNDNESATSGSYIGQSPPTVSHIILLPSQIDSDTTPTVFYNYTGTGTLDIQINWYVGGNWVQSNLTTLSPTHFVAGNTITVQVSASDGTDNVSVISTGVIVQPKPTVSNIILLPTQVDTDTTPTVFYNYTGSGTLRCSN